MNSVDEADDLSGRLYAACSVIHVQLFVTPWTVAPQAPLSMGFPRQEYRSGLPFSAPADLLDPGIEPVPSVSPVLAGKFYTSEIPGKSFYKIQAYKSSDVIYRFASEKQLQQNP